MIAPIPIIRVARPSDDLDALLPFYVEGLGMEVLVRFEDHAGFDGIVVGRKDWPYHLEFTRARGHVAGRAPTQDHLLVFYYPDERDWHDSVARMAAHGFRPVRSFNPYWELSGRTFEDPDGYRVVFQQGRWSV
jgi:catechol 2,3-dioxygenase-like lactoylglutathione lyase family enzyme